MNLEALADLSWREALLVSIALLAIYLVVAFLRMRRLRNEKLAASSRASGTAQSAVAAYESEQTPVEEAPVEPASEPAFAWNEPPPDNPLQRQLDTLERTVTALRDEVMLLRSELRLVQDEFRQELSQARAAPNVSPVYSDAMQMAIQGHDATAISEYCGIARAEAELVVALVRNRESSH